MHIQGRAITMSRNFDRYDPREKPAEPSFDRYAWQHRPLVDFKPASSGQPAPAPQAEAVSSPASQSSDPVDYMKSVRDLCRWNLR